MLCFMKAKGSLWSFSARMELFIYPHVVYVEHEEAHVCVLPLVSHYFTDQQAVITCKDKRLRCNKCRGEEDCTSPPG